VSVDNLKSALSSIHASTSVEI